LIRRQATAAVFFDFAGTLFSGRDLRDLHLRRTHFVAKAAVGDVLAIVGAEANR
jgi:hypothetical protein